MNALRKIEQALGAIGYMEETLFHNYGFADVLMSEGETRTVTLAAFTQTPESFRSAAFGVVVSDQPEDAIMANRALGAPIFLSISGEDVGVWRVGSSTRPSLIKRVGLDEIGEYFLSRADEWAPQALHRAKSLGAHNPVYQVDFIDLGLLPAIENEVQVKLQRVLGEVITLLAPEDSSQDVQKVAFRITFRLLAAKILADRQHPDAQKWAVDDVDSVLQGIEAYYRLPIFGQDSGTIERAKVAKAWDIFRGTLNLRNISSDSLAFVYENTLVTADTRKLFGTHSTPRAVAEFMLNQLDLSQFDIETMRVVEPFAGAGIFLVSALRQMRDQLPADWSAKQRHDYLTSRLVGSELDVFACEVATLSLILADYPNANGWKVKQRDLFLDGALKEVLEGATVVLCNPPFEDFSLDERAKYPQIFESTPSKEIAALNAALDARPLALGFVLPRGVLQQKQYSKVRARLAEQYSKIELVSLPDRIFEKATYPSALVIATKLKPSLNSDSSVRLISNEVRDADREAFLKSGTVSSTRSLTRNTPLDHIWVRDLDEIWHYLEANSRLADQTKISRGLEWHVQERGVSKEPAPGFKKGVYRPGPSLSPFAIGSTTWLNMKPEENRRSGPLQQNWDQPKVLVNRHRISRGPWRLAAAFDTSGLVASQQFTGLWPTGIFSGRVLAAILNSPVANAYATEHTTDHDFTNTMLGKLPLPKRLDHAALEIAVVEYEKVIGETNSLLHTPDEVRLNRLLLIIDALVLKGYDLPPRLERRLLDYFDNATRPTRHHFSGWFPSSFRGFMPLHEWLSKLHEANRGAWVSQVFKPVPVDEADALARFVD